MSNTQEPNPNADFTAQLIERGRDIRTLPPVADRDLVVMATGNARILDSEVFVRGEYPGKWEPRCNMIATRWLYLDEVPVVPREEDMSVRHVASQMRAAWAFLSGASKQHEIVELQLPQAGKTYLCDDEQRTIDRVVFDQGRVYVEWDSEHASGSCTLEEWIAGGWGAVS